MALFSNGYAFTVLARRDPEAVAIICADERVTRLQLEQAACRLARKLLSKGVKAGDFVTIALPNSIAFFEACLACWKIGAIPNPVSSRLPKRERDQLISLAKPALIIGVDDDYGDTVVLSGSLADSDEVCADALPDILPVHGKVMATGGSTGLPKLIVDAKPAATEIDVAPNFMKINGCVLVPGPLYHTGPFVTAMQGLFAGCRLVVMPRFDAEQAIRLIAEQEVDWVLFVPTMMSRIWKLPEAVKAQYDIACLRVVMSTGAPTPVWLKQAWIDWLGPEKIIESYGGSERIGATQITGTEWLQHRGSVGRPVAGTRILILDDKGCEVPVGQIGEVYLLPASGEDSTFSYIGAHAKKVKGYQTLGDLGYLDADGYLYLVDRRVDMIVSGGANIYPAEVEAAIEACPCVRSCAVIGLPDEDLGQRVHAIVDIDRGALDEFALRNHLAEYLVAYKLPRTIEFVSELLRDDAGKIRRSALREQRL
ncbi:MAG: AMP-binding protein [Pseudomonadales bacterium]|nr:AMP-binding protein [Pseudomonadales bacterium]